MEQYLILSVLLVSAYVGIGIRCACDWPHRRDVLGFLVVAIFWPIWCQGSFTK